jgi:hypothetical protein
MTKPTEKTELVPLPTTMDLATIAKHFETHPSLNDADKEAQAQYTPWLKLCQQTSPEIKEHDEKYIKDIKAGDFFNAQTGKIYGKGPLKFNVVVNHHRQCVRYADKKVVEVDIPSGDPRIYLPGNDPNKAIESWTITVYLPEHNELLWYRPKSKACAHYVQFTNKVTAIIHERKEAGKEAIDLLVNGTMRSHWIDEGPNKQYFVPLFDCDGIAEGKRRAAVLTNAVHFATKIPRDLDLYSVQDEN